MYKNETFAECKVEILLKNGLYLLPTWEPCGKTRLYRLLKKIWRDTGDVYSYSYEDYQRQNRDESFLKKILMTKDLKVVMFDRYTMFHTVCKEELIECSQHGIVLVDLKSDHFGGFNGVETICDMESDEHSITVYDASEECSDYGDNTPHSAPEEEDQIKQEAARLLEEKLKNDAVAKNIKPRQQSR